MSTQQAALTSPNAEVSGDERSHCDVDRVIPERKLDGRLERLSDNWQALVHMRAVKLRLSRYAKDCVRDEIGPKPYRFEDTYSIVDADPDGDPHFALFRASNDRLIEVSLTATDSDSAFDEAIKLELELNEAWYRDFEAACDRHGAGRLDMDADQLDEQAQELLAEMAATPAEGLKGLVLKLTAGLYAAEVIGVFDGRGGGAEIELLRAAGQDAVNLCDEYPLWIVRPDDPVADEALATHDDT